MTKRFQFGALAVMLVGGLLGYSLASGGRDQIEEPLVEMPQLEQHSVTAKQPEFVIDDCCTFPGMTQAELLTTLHDQPMKERTETRDHEDRPTTPQE